jgi:hypothetical protein
MNKITSLTDLQKVADTESINKCFTEYMLMSIAKVQRLDTLLKDLENMNDTDMLSVADLKRRLE